MQIKDIEIGQRYAFGNRTDDAGSPWLTVGEVLGKGNGQVRFGTVAGERTVPSRMVICDEAYHLEERERLQRRNAERNAWLDESVAKRQAAQARLLELVGDEALPWWAKGEIKAHNDRSGISGGKGDLDVAELLTLIQTALDNAQEA